MMGLFCILQSISPHAYKFLRNSGYLNIPHPRTMRKICTSLKTNPQTEQSNENFLAYMKKKGNILKSVDKTVILMLDEIHLKSYLDFKGGNILGMAYNSEQAATSAYVFMIQSLLSPFKEVVHIMPVKKKIDGEKLFAVVKKTIVELDGIGFKVIGVVSDNNSINRKAMSNFSFPPKLSIVHPHPSDSSNPLFFVIDSVHIFRCIRNNWINQKNAGQCFYFPDFEDHNKFPLLEANFSTLKQLYDIESNNLVKFAYGLTLKALCPTNLEKQNVKLVLKIFNNFVIQGLQLLGEQHKLISYETTSIFIS
ncbi:transposable element P transposase [Trichonephila clavipes]|uniref:Transposable element P transposase n=1 Tax=Trichonephila clavipes TaxID=2585209 RepID=A0A8X6RCU8_TRICX|nr:transposable element P transposase [Trichonephila clavipes]